MDQSGLGLPRDQYINKSKTDDRVNMIGVMLIISMYVSLNTYEIVSTSPPMLILLKYHLDYLYNDVYVYIVEIPLKLLLC